MILYADVVFIENLCINYIILLITGKILGRKISKIRTFVASILGGIYSIYSYINMNTSVISMLTKIIFSFAMVKIAFKSSKFKEVLYQIISFYLVTFGLGGSIFAILFTIGKNKIIIKNGTIIGISSAKLLITGIVVGYMIIIKTIKILKKIIKNNSLYGNIRIIINKKELEIKAMLDTGNLLVEPISKTPVVIVEKEKLSGIVPEEILNLGGGVEERRVRDEYISKVKIIPYSSVGKDDGILIGIRADKMIIELDNKKYETEDIVIGIYNEGFKNDGKYSALLGRDILERGKIVNEYIANTKKQHKYYIC